MASAAPYLMGAIGIKTLMTPAPAAPINLQQFIPQQVTPMPTINDQTILQQQQKAAKAQAAGLTRAQTVMSDSNVLGG